MRKQIKAEPILEHCRALIDQIIDGLSVEKPVVNISSAAGLLFYLEFAASTLKKSPARARKRRETKIVTRNYQRHGRPTRAANPLTAKGRG